MANSNILVQQIANFARVHIKLVPVIGVGGIQDEPALSIANNVLQEFLAPPYNWKWNRNEMTMLVTQQYKQDYLFAGGSAFVLQNSTNAVAPNCGGVGIGLASSSAITQVGNTTTVNTLEAHPFQIGQTSYIIGTNSAYDSNYTLSSTGQFSGGYTITAVPSRTSFQFTHPQSGLGVSGAPGITNFGWLESVSRIDVSNTSLPQPVSNESSVVRMLPVTSQTETPIRFAVVQDYGTGVLRIRCWPLPTQFIWGVNLVFQGKAPLLSSLTNIWSPIPDELSYVYRQGFLAQCYRFVDKATYLQEYQLFQQLIMKALAEKDSEQSMEGISPEFGLLRG
jgi:hypothetical protein